MESKKYCCFQIISIFVALVLILFEPKYAQTKPNKGSQKGNNPAKVTGDNTGTGGILTNANNGNTLNLRGTLGNLPTVPNVNTGSGGSGNYNAGSFKSMAVMTICAMDDDLTSECRESSIEQASKKLAGMILREYTNGCWNLMLRVIFSSELTFYEQIKTIKEIEIKAIKISFNTMKADLEKLKPFRIDTEEIRREKLLVVQQESKKIEQWNRQARAEANSCMNWTSNNSAGESSSSSNNYSPSSNYHNSSFDYSPGQAMRQLQYINLSSWTGQ